MRADNAQAKGKNFSGIINVGAGSAKGAPVHSGSSRLKECDTANGWERRRIASLLAALYSLQTKSEFQHCVFLLERFLCDQLLEVLRFASGLCETEGACGYTELSA